MMNIEGLRWGYDGGGFCCGPQEGSSNLEIAFTDGEGKHAFISLSVYMGFFQIRTTTESIFERLMRMPMDEEPEKLLAEVEAATLDVYDYEIGDLRDEFLADSPYRHLVRLVHIAWEAYLSLPGDATQESADAFIAPYVGRDVDAMNLPVVYESYDGEEEDGDDDVEEPVLEIKGIRWTDVPCGCMAMDETPVVEVEARIDGKSRHVVLAVVDDHASFHCADEPILEKFEAAWMDLKGDSFERFRNTYPEESLGETLLDCEFDDETPQGRLEHFAHLAMALSWREEDLAPYIGRNLMEMELPPMPDPHVRDGE